MTPRHPAAGKTPDPGTGLAGRSIGHYQVLEEIGHGGMGRVYLAEDETLGRSIALKVLAAEIAGDRQALHRFEQEARLLGGLAHPNIAMVHSLEEEEGVRFFTMELVPGETLEDRISGQPIPIDSALSIVRQIARALEAAHGKGVVHRDLKPSNVRVTPEEHVKVLDFGLAREIDPDTSSTTTTSGDTTPRGGIAGTPGYMSPEQLRELPVDERTDVWSFGCVLYECLTGQLAFPGRTRAERIAATLERTPDWSAVPAETGARLRSLVNRCLAKSREDRPREAREVRQEIDEEIARRRLGVPLETEDEPPCCAHNLPRRLDAFVGREKEASEVTRLLEDVPLLTLTGAGGSGKSRLATEVATSRLECFPDGVWLVELAPVDDPGHVPHAVARAVGCKEVPNRSLEEALVQFLRDRKALLILDNCEHVLLSVTTLVEALVRGCPQLVILATSREALGIAGETQLQVPSLAVPEAATLRSVDELREVESVRLFAERARAVRADFALTEENVESVAEICRRLDGIPLALELAAARVRTMTVTEIKRRLSDRFSLLREGSRTSLPRHQTLRALIDWSYELLEPSERTLLQRLSVFSGGWTLDAAERVCSDDDLPEWDVVDLHSRLVEKSLVEMIAEGTREIDRTRYRMLWTVRQYARELSEPVERQEIRRRHRDFYVSLAEEAEPFLRGGEQTRWLARLALEHENLRAALATSGTDDGDPEPGLRLAGALGRYWMVRGHWAEGRDLCDLALRSDPDRTPTHPRAKTLNAAGNVSFHLGDYEMARARHQEALEIRQHLGDRHDEAMSLNNLGEVARLKGDYALAQQFYQRALSIQRDLDDRWGLAVSLNNLGEAAQNQGNYEEAQSFHEEACTFWPVLGDRWGLAFSLGNLGFVASKRGRLSEARECYEKALALSRELEDRYKIALALRQIGEVALEQRDWNGAASSLRESLGIRRDLGDREGIADSLESCAALLSARNQSARAARLLGAAEAVRELIHAPAATTRQGELLHLAEEIARTLGDERSRAERDRGRHLLLEDAIAVALEATGNAGGPGE